MRKVGVFFLGFIIAMFFSALAGAAEFRSEKQAQYKESLVRITENVKLSGYVFGNYKDNLEEGKSNFTFHGIALDMTAAIWENALFSAELFTHPDNAIKDTPYFLYAYLDYSFNDLATLRFGRFLAPWGKFNEMHDPPHRDLSTHPLTQQYLAPVHWNEQGVQLWGNTSWGGDRLLSYNIYLSNGINEKRVTSPQYPFPPAGDNNDDPAIGGRIMLLPTKKVDMGLSGYYGKWDDKGNNDLLRFNVDFSYDYFNTYGPISLKFEYMWSEVEGNPAADNSSGDYSQDGFFVQTAYKFLEQKDSYWKGVLRYDQIDRNSTVKNKWDRERWTTGLVYSPIPPLKFYAEYAWVDTGQANYDPNYLELAVSWKF